MSEYFNNIYIGLRSFWKGLSLTFKHMKNKEELVATLQYPNEKWPIPERNIGFDMSEYNVVRSRLHVDMDDCIGCLQCERACPVDCIKIDTIKPSKDSDIDCGVTSLGTQKKLVVPRFTIDMSECMYCNLCVYPCPEECIYMVGGPNEDKHEMDYEFSQYSRDGLIFEFANATDEDIVSAGGEDYIKNRDSKLDILKDGEELKGKEIIPEPNKKKESTPAKSASATEVSEEITHKSFNDLEDKMQRGIVKKTFLTEKKQGKTDKEILKSIESVLKDKDLLNDQAIALISRLGSSKQADKPVAADEITHKSFNDLEDKMQRGMAKKTFLTEKKQGKSDSEILSAIENAFKDKDILNDQAKQLLSSLSSGGSSSEPEEISKGGLFEMKKLNELEDKLARGLAKKTYIKSKKDDKNSSEILVDIESALKEADKFTDEAAAVLSKIKESL